jgi:hypothetical protein
VTVQDDLDLLAEALQEHHKHSECLLPARCSCVALPALARVRERIEQLEAALHIFDDPRYTIDALIELQTAIVRFNDRYEVWRDGMAEADPDAHVLRMAREWDGLDLPSVVPVLREATRMVDLLSGHDWEQP